MSIRFLKHPVMLSFSKYVLAGGSGFLLDYLVLTICFELLGLHYLCASSLGFVAGLIFVYLLSNRWVFSRRRLRERAGTEFLVFAIIGVLGLVLTVFLMWLFVDVVCIYPLIAKLITTALVLLWNFGARKIILYS